MIKQEKYSKKNLTKQLIELGFSSEDENGFQCHELINFLPSEIIFKNTYYGDKKSAFINRDKKTKFIPEIRIFKGYTFGYQLKQEKQNKYDQAHCVDNIVDMFAEMLIYVTRQLSYQDNV